MAKTVLALVEVGYTTYAMPLALVEQLVQMRKVSKRYGAAGCVYWYDETESTKFDVTVVDAAAIAQSDPGEAPAHVPPAAPIAPPVDEDEWHRDET